MEKHSLEEYLTELKASIVGLGFQCHKDTYEAAVEALEKQVPEEVIENGYGVYFCPKCHGSVWQIACESKFCFRCGKALRWRWRK